MKTKIESNKAPAAIGPYSQAISTDNLVFVSGQIPVDIITGSMPSTIEEQTRQSLTNIKYILQDIGLTMDNIVKTTVLLNDMNNFAKMNEVYASFFDKDAPARACFEVSRLPKDAMIEIEAIAVK